MSLSHVRRDYSGQSLLESDAGDDPVALFARWLEHAGSTEADPTAMALATANASGRPSLRTVLLKGFDARGLVFYTNFDSRKARDLAENNQASVLFFWRSCDRQVRVEGLVEQVSDAEADAYFSSRPLESRLSVYASRQSSAIENREVLDELFEQAQRRFADGDVPRPPWWGGYRLIPREFEFWQGRPHRMHDRLRYVKETDGAWRRERLAP